MKPISISRALARRLALEAQLLDGSGALPAGKEGVAGAIEALGYVQIDTISVVERAHHQTLWTRRPDYDPSMLHELHAVDRRIFEYWAHAASYIPMSDYRFYLPRMREFVDPQSRWNKERVRRCGHLMEPVLQRIRAEGPLSSKDFEAPPDTTRGAWWDWRPAKVALELLFWRGDLMIAERRSFQRVYDLTERVLPSGVDTTMPDAGELGRFLVRRALMAYGVAQARAIADHIRGGSRELIGDAIAEMVEASVVVPVTLEGDDDAEFFALAGSLEAAAEPDPTPARVHFLSPFDNLIIQRDRLARLFDFAYTLECYLPATKRQHGYFVFPILWGDRFVGRMDPKAERKKKTLVIRSLRFEAGFEEFDWFLPQFAAKLAEFARFNGCRRITVEEIEPASIAPALERLLADAL